MGENNNNKNAAKGLGAAASIVGMLTNTISSASNLAAVPENDFQEGIDSINAMQFSTNSYDSIANQLNNFSFAKTNYTGSDFGGLSGGEAAGTILANGLNGALEGAAAFSPWGAFKGLGDIVAGTIGYGIGQGRKARESQQLNYNASAANQSAISRIENSNMNVGKHMRDTDLLNISAFGGPLDTTFTNGVRFITEGGSHEQNPYSGVLQGFAQDGLPNLVEEGEVIYNDYVYSKRLKVPRADKESLGLKKDKDYTYADAANQIQKESEERPNDPISKRNLDEMMSRLQGSQEALKEKRDSQALKRAVNKMTPDELAMFMQQLQQPQQMQPMMAMQGMQPMQPTQSEVPMFSKGGLLGHKYGGLSPSWNTPDGVLTFATRRSLGKKGDITDENEGNRMMYEIYEDPTGTDVNTDGPGFISPEITINSYGNVQTPSDKRVLGENGEVVGTDATPSDTKSAKGFSLVQALRTAPIFGGLASTIASLFDKPNYSNIKRAERAAAAVSRVGAGHIGQRLAYNPIDINYIATQQGNQGIGARRALVESGAGPQAIVANNYANQVALGQAIMQANQLNRQNLAQALEFNRGTDTVNISNDLQAALANQQRAANYANFLLQTGQLRDAELARVQANRSTGLTNLFNNLGNLGQDMLDRKQAAAVAASLEVTYNDLMKALALTSTGKNIDAKGGKLNTKKGGKDA